MATSSTVVTTRLLLLLLLLLGASVHAAVLTPEQKVEAVEAHNRLRRSVHPPAADMILLTWNPRLEQLAQQAADSCNLEHNYGGPYAGLGENIYRGQRVSVTEIIELFFAEHAAFDYNAGVCNVARTQNSIGAVSCGHYLQEVGANVAEVGCAMANCTAASAVLPEHLFFCEYNVLHSGPLPYTSGPPCSKCPDTRTNCARGLCANFTTAANVTAGNATCSLHCLNCGNLVDLGSLACACNCPSGFRGPYCAEKTSASASPPASCTVCQAQATPCRNGSNETSSAASGAASSSSPSCSCSCQPEFRGPACRQPRDAFDHAVLVGLRGPQMCSNGRCGSLPPPMDPTRFRDRIWPTLSAQLAVAVNSFCSANATNFAVCCPNGTFGGGGGGQALVHTEDFGYIEASVAIGADADLLVAVFAVAQSGNSMCAGGVSGRRRRATATPTPVTYSLLSAAVQSSQSLVSANMSSCCGVSVASLQEYRLVADSSTSGSSGGSGGVTAGPGVVIGNSGHQSIHPRLPTVVAMATAVAAFEMLQWLGK